MIAKAGHQVTSASDADMSPEQHRAMADAMRAAEDARHAADRARDAAKGAREAAAQSRRIIIMHRQGDVAQASLEQTRARMIRQCAERGSPVGPGERDWATLATCDRSVIVSALQSARAEIARSRDLSGTQIARATASIDTAIARMKSDRAH